MKRVLVTGASGCIGSHALPLLLERGWDVHAITSRPGALRAGVTWHQADLLRQDEAAAVVETAKPAALLHLAWYVAPGRWADAPENLDWVTASLNLARAFARSGGTRLVVAGSGLEYDWRYGYCSEALTPCAPHTLYGTSKHALHLLLDHWAPAAGVNVGWARVFFVYGPHEHPLRLVAHVMNALLRGERARCSHGRQVRDYLFAGDVADALVTLLESNLQGPINVASGDAISLRALVSRAAELIGRPDLVDFGAIPAAATDAPLVVADVSRLANELQWRPRFSLDDGLSATIEWWRARLASEACNLR